jgi:hypothetical protein
MKYIVIPLIMSLSACTSVPVVAEFPAAPEMLMERCADLKTISGQQVSIVDFVKTVTENYTTYHECSAKTSGWQEWYVKQKKIWDNTK